MDSIIEKEEADEREKVRQEVCVRNSRDLQYKEFTLQTYNVHAMLTFLVWKCSPTSIIQTPLAVWTSQGFG